MIAGGRLESHFVIVNTQVAMLNFVAAAPILVLGTFDRCLSKEYVRANPQVYRSTRENELMNIRTMMRWIVLTLFHVYLLFGLTVPQQSYGGGITPGFNGLMRNASPDTPGDGEGGDLKSVGTVTFICMIILFAYKVRMKWKEIFGMFATIHSHTFLVALMLLLFLLLLLYKQVMYESRSILHGKWPAPVCRDGEGCLSRLGYSWVGMTYLSIGFFLWSITIYSLVGYQGASNFSDYVDVAMHVMGTRSLSWILILFVPIMGMVFDIILKVFSNMYYPTQTQIHVEIEAMQKRDRKRALRQERRQATPRLAQSNPQQQQANGTQREDRTLQRRGLSSLDVSRISNDKDASRISDDNKNNNSKGGGDHDDARDLDELEV
jgi:magnesium-transporting ATPase (P-type)